MWEGGIIPLGGKGQQPLAQGHGKKPLAACSPAAPSAGCPIKQRSLTVACRAYRQAHQHTELDRA